jgi:triacylglycerol lipase
MHNGVMFFHLSSNRSTNWSGRCRNDTTTELSHTRETAVVSSLIPSDGFPRLSAPIVLAHGLFGFKRLGIGGVTIASYFRGIPDVLQAAGNQVLVTRVPPIASVEDRASRLGEQIVRAFPNRPVHLIGHSMGGLDARQLLADPAWPPRILSLTTIGSPHLGSSLADFAKLRFGRVWRLVTALGIDPQGCLDVTRQSARRFHRTHPVPEAVPCFCVAGVPTAETVCWPLRRTHAALQELEGPNDGLVSAESAHAFGTPLPAWPVDHLRQMNWLPTNEAGPAISDVIPLYAQVIENLASLGFGSEVILPFDSRS